MMFRHLAISKAPPIQQPGQMITPIMRAIGFDRETGAIEAEFLSAEDYRAFQASLLALCGSDPLAQMKVISKYRIPVHDRNMPTLLKSLADTATKNQDYDAAEQLWNAVERSSSREQKRNAKWDTEWATYHALIIPALVDGLRVENNQSSTHRLMQSFNRLRKMRPADIRPFVPLITVLNRRFDTEWLKKIVADAVAVDEHKAYGLIRLHLLMSASLTRDDKRSTVVGYDTDALAVIQAQWPADRFMNGMSADHLMGAASDKAIQVNVEPIVTHLNAAFAHLLSGRFQMAVNELGQGERYWIGNTDIHRFLGLAYALAGDATHAIGYIERSKLLPEWPRLGPLAAIMTESLHGGAAVASGEPATNAPETELLSAFLSLIQNETSDVSSDEPWSNAALKVMSCSCGSLDHNPSSQVKALPLIYWMVDWVASKTWKIEPDYVDRYLTKVQELMTRVYAIYDATKPEGAMAPFVNNAIKRIGHGESCQLQVAIMNTVGFPAPTAYFEFGSDMELTQSSVNSVAASIVHMLYQVVVDLVTMPVEMEGSPQADADRRGLRARLIIASVQDAVKNPGQWPLVGDDIDRNIRFGTTDPDVLGWATYVRSVTDAKTSAIVDEVKIPQFRNTVFGRLQFPTPTAIRMAQAGFRYLTQRTHIDHVVIPADTVSIADLFQFAMHYMGPRRDESFAQWGDRLVRGGLLPPHDYDVLVETARNSGTARLAVAIEAPMNSHVSLRALRQLLALVVDIHQHITEKNACIQAGGEDDPRDISGWELSLNQWIRTNPSQWETMVMANDPSPYLKKLDSPFQNEFKKRLAGKHDHSVEVAELKTMSTKIQSTMDRQTRAVLAAAFLLENCRNARSDGGHSIFVPDQETADMVSRILFEVAVQQIFKDWLVEKGPSVWRLRNEPGPIDDLCERLRVIVDAFHGPETHMTGNGPIHRHINAGVWVGRNTLENSHIYF